MTNLQRFAAQPQQQGLTKAIHKAYMLSCSMDLDILNRGETDVIEWNEGELELYKKYSNLYIRLIERMIAKYRKNLLTNDFHQKSKDLLKAFGFEQMSNDIFYIKNLNSKKHRFCISFLFKNKIVFKEEKQVAGEWFNFDLPNIEFTDFESFKNHITTWQQQNLTKEPLK